ncbi:MAG: RNA polymerase sigma factor, partial [Sphingobacteriia bacterium]
VQDCFVRVVENLPRYDARYAFTTWIYTIAYNLCKNHYRKQGNARKALEVAKNGHAPHTAAEAGGRIDSQVYQDVLQRAIRALKPDLQQLIALRFEQELELKEIGQIMGVPEGTIKSRLHYTLKTLAHVLGPVQSRL